MTIPSGINVAQISQESGMPITAVWSVISCNPIAKLDVRQYLAIVRVLEAKNLLDQLPHHPRKGLPYIGIITSNFIALSNGNYGSELFESIKQRAKAANIPILSYHQQGENYAGIAEFVKHLSGVVMICAENTQEIIEACEAHNTPFAGIESESRRPSPIGTEVVSDNRQGQRIAIEHLLNYGHRRIAYVTGRKTSASASERLDGYKDALNAAGIPFDASLVVEGDWTNRSGEEAGLELLKREPRPTAIACANDYTALGIYDAIIKKGLRPGKDIQVVGYDDIEISSQITPGLTTMRQPIESMAQLAWDHLQALRSDSASHQAILSVPAEYVERQSTHRV